MIYLSARHKSNCGASSDLNCNDTSKLNNKISTLKWQLFLGILDVCINHKITFLVLISGSIIESKILHDFFF